VKDYVRLRKLSQREMFVPLEHPPGDAQADFGEAMVVIAGVECKAHYLAMDLPRSDDCFVMAFPAETTEAFLEGHNHAFAYFGGVPRTILYDNTKIAVARIFGDGTRAKTRAFTELQSHHLFAEKGALARATTRGRWKGWWATRGGTSGCRVRDSPPGKTHIALAACQKGFRVRFTTAASLAHELIEAKGERRLMRFQKMLASFEILIIDELGFVPLSKTGAELLFEVFSRRYARSATLV